MNLMKRIPPKPQARPALKPFDIPVIVFAAALTVLAGAAAYRAGTASSRVIIRGPERNWIFPLDAEERVSVTGTIGETVVEIRGGRAAIVSSPCGGQTCVAGGSLHRNGQWAACLPNGVFLLVEGTEGGDGIDAASW